MEVLLKVFALLGLAATVSANFCYVCSTALQPNCLVPDERQLLSDCISTANNNTCFTRIQDRHVVRGCSATMSREDFVNCQSQPTCELCYSAENGGRCNGAVYPAHRLHCHQCSGHVNDTCGHEITITPTLCNLYDVEDQCYVSVVADLVQRGCLSENEYCRVSQSCHTCDGNGCNFRHYEDSGALSVVISLKTLLMALLASFAYSSFRQ